MYINIAIVIPAIISSIFQGSYIDKFGFSLPTRLPLVGITIACGVSAIVALTDVRHELLIVGMVFMGACGHTPAFMMAANAYVVKDASGEKNKTLRLAIVGSCLAIGISAGTAVIGPISDHLGLYWVFLIGLFSSLLALLDSVLRVRAPRHQPPVPHGKHFLNKLKETLELRTMKSYIKVMTRSREHSRRLHMHLMTLVFVISFCALIGVVDVEFLYLTKEKGFTTTQASTFMSVAMLLMFFGKTLGTYVLSSKLGLNLIYITMIGSLSAIINYTGFSLANSFAALWASNVFKMFSGLNSVMTRSYVSGCVEMNEQGTIISFMSVTEAMFKLIASFVFNGLYPLTLTTWPGAMFMVAAVLCVSGLPVLGFIRWHELRTGAKYVIMNEWWMITPTQSLLPTQSLMILKYKLCRVLVLLVLVLLVLVQLVLVLLVLVLLVLVLLVLVQLVLVLLVLVCTRIRNTIIAELSRNKLKYRCVSYILMKYSPLRLRVSVTPHTFTVLSQEHVYICLSSALNAKLLMKLQDIESLYLCAYQCPLY